MNLVNLYRRYADQPGDFERFVGEAFRTTVAAASGPAGQELPPDFEELRDRIMPIFMPQDFFDQTAAPLVRTVLASEPWLAGLDVAYVVDEESAFWYLRREMIDHWDLTLDDIRSCALTNLDQYFEKTPVELLVGVGHDGRRIAIPERRDTYNAVRVLSQRFRRHLNRSVGKQCLILLPARDVFVTLTHTREREFLHHLRHQTRLDYGSGEHPLVSDVFVVRETGLTVLKS